MSFAGGEGQGSLSVANALFVPQVHLPKEEDGPHGPQIGSGTVSILSGDLFVISFYDCLCWCVYIIFSKG